MTTPPAGYRTSIEIDAEPSVVFDHLVTPAGMTAWMGTWADIDPRPGGTFAVDVAGAAIRGTFLEVDRPHRVVVSWGMAGSSELPPGASTVEFILTAVGAGTRVDLVHTGLPGSALAGHADGWRNYLSRLRAVGAGGDPGFDTWSAPADPTPTAQREDIR